MLFTRTVLLILLLDALLFIGGTGAPALLYLAALYLALVLSMVVADWRLTPGPREFEVTRINDSRLSLGAENLVRVIVGLRGGRAVRLRVRDEFPALFRADTLILGKEHRANGAAPEVGASESRRAPLRLASVFATLSGAREEGWAGVAPGAPAEFRYHVRPPRRGDYQFGDLNLRWRGVLGLIIRQARFPASAPVKVYPNLLDIRKYELLVRKGQLTEMGLRTTRMLGTGTEFERLREYQLDDEFHRIDWKATARRGKPITREFQTERSQNIMALLDVGRLMRSPVGDLAKLDYAVNAVLMLSYVAGLRGDRVGLLAFADEVTTYLSPKAGKGQFYRMLATLYGIESQPVESDLVRAFAYLGARHNKRSLIVVFSDLASGIAAKTVVSQIAPLWPRHLPIYVAISDPSVIALAEQPLHDSATVYQRAVAEQIVNERALTMELLRSRGVMTLDVPANQLTISVVNKYLELKARGKI